MSNSIYNIPKDDTSLLLPNDEDNNIVNKAIIYCYWGLIISIISFIIGPSIWCLVKYYT